MDHAHRPLWRILLPILFLSFAAHRAAASAMAWGGAAPREIAFATGLEAAAAVFAAVGFFLGGRMAVVSVVVLGVAMAASAITMAFVLGAAAVPAAMSRVLVAAIGTAAFLWMLRMEREPPTRRDVSAHPSRAPRDS